MDAAASVVEIGPFQAQSLHPAEAGQHEEPNGGTCYRIVTFLLGLCDGHAERRHLLTVEEPRPLLARFSRDPAGGVDINPLLLAGVFKNGSNHAQGPGGDSGSATGQPATPLMAFLGRCLSGRNVLLHLL